jgi:hypothetical protein
MIQSDSISRLDVPCLHRIHIGQASGSHLIHEAIGMSIEMNDLIHRLERLNEKAAELKLPDNSFPVTFDDGWIDALKLQSVFESLNHIQPVLFLTMRQLRGDWSLLPLPRLYDSVSDAISDIDDIDSLRERLKGLCEEDQHALLDSMELPRDIPSPEMIGRDRLGDLVDSGWLIGSHSHDHHDLRFDDALALEEGLREALDATLEAGGVPWLAWPEGRCRMEGCEIAKAVGFERQFSLNVPAGMVDHPDLIRREIWR